MAAIAPIKLDSATVSATVFDNLLVLASFKSAQSQFELDQAVDTLGVFTDKTAVLALKHHKNSTIDKFPLEPGFNYIRLTNKINGLINIELID